MGKVPEYTRRANEKYRAARDSISFVAPAGTRDRIRAAIDGASLAAYLNELIDADLRWRETSSASDLPVSNRITLELDPDLLEAIRKQSGGDIASFIDAAIMEKLNR